MGKEVAYLTEFFSFDTSIRSRRINEGEHRKTKFLCMAHESQSFPIPASVNRHTSFNDDMLEIKNTEFQI